MGKGVGKGLAKENHRADFGEVVHKSTGTLLRAADKLHGLGMLLKNQQEQLLTIDADGLSGVGDIMSGIARKLRKVHASLDEGWVHAAHRGDSG